MLEFAVRALRPDRMYKKCRLREPRITTGTAGIKQDRDFLRRAAILRLLIGQSRRRLLERHHLPLIVRFPPARTLSIFQLKVEPRILA